MDVKGNGGPPTFAWIPWAGQENPDRSLFRTPESRALQHCKDEIQREPRWDDFKKITNPYEYVFLSWNRRSSRSVAARQPLSRSYFKMIEMWVSLNFTDILHPLVTPNGGHLLTAHAAEGPGGFIEACWEHATRQGWRIPYTSAITLRSDARNIPGWRKATRFLADRVDAIRIHEGADGTGDILVADNQDAYIRDTLLKAPNGVHVYTADGGFDFSSDYHAQEDVIFPLLLAEGLLGLQVLAQGGCMVLKCFDTTERPTLDFLWMLCHAFREWVLVKPRTSRAGNAERYFVGLHYLGAKANADTIAFLKTYQEAAAWTQPLLTHSDDPTYKRKWATWISDMLKFQESIESQEYETIRKTLALIKAYDYGRIRSLVRENITRSIEWCKDYGEPLSQTWSAAEFERSVSRETQDLLHILSGSSMVPGSTSVGHSQPHSSPHAPSKTSPPSSSFIGTASQAHPTPLCIGRSRSNVSVPTSSHAWYNRTPPTDPASAPLSFVGFRRSLAVSEPDEDGWQSVPVRGSKP